MDSSKYIGMDMHTESVSIAVRNSFGKMVMECVIETRGCGETCMSPLRQREPIANEKQQTRDVRLSVAFRYRYVRYEGSGDH